MISLLTYFKSAPPFSVWQSHPNKKPQILVTAGVDGDEDSGIQAAQLLIKNYNLNVPLLVIPIVNLAGYKAKTSYNPLDGRYPKHIFPGSRVGSSSSRLMYQVAKYSRGVKLWIDLHSGATQETLIPFAWAPEPYPVLSHLNTRVLVEKSVKKNLPYIMLEGAELSWIYSLIGNLDKPAKLNWQPTYTKIKYQKFVSQKPDSHTLWYSHDIFVSGY